MKPLAKDAGWQVVPLRISMPRRNRITWRARWPVMIAPTYTSSPRRVNGLYVRLGERAHGASVMPRRPRRRVA